MPVPMILGPGLETVSKPRSSEGRVTRVPYFFSDFARLRTRVTRPSRVLRILSRWTAFVLPPLSNCGKECEQVWLVTQKQERYERPGLRGLGPIGSTTTRTPQRTNRATRCLKLRANGSRSTSNSATSRTWRWNSPPRLASQTKLNELACYMTSGNMPNAFRHSPRFHPARLKIGLLRRCARVCSSVASWMKQMPAAAGGSDTRVGLSVRG